MSSDYKQFKQAMNISFAENGDFRKQMKTQAAMIEKLITKNKKLKDGKMKKDFPGIFNLNRNEDDEMQPVENEADMKTYK